MPSLLELRKFDSRCYKHTIHGEIKIDRTDQLCVILFQFKVDEKLHILDIF